MTRLGSSSRPARETMRLPRSRPPRARAHIPPSQAPTDRPCRVRAPDAREAGFVALLGGVDAPTKSLPQHIAASAERIGRGKFRIDLAGGLREPDRFKVQFPGEFVEAGKRAKVIVVGVKTVGRLALDTLGFRPAPAAGRWPRSRPPSPGPEVRRCRRASLSNVRPQMCPGRRVEQLRGNPHVVAGLAHAAFEHIAHAELASDLLDVDGLPL